MSLQEPSAPPAQRNPVSSGALTRDEVGANIKFTWYTPFHKETVVHGTFLTDPYFDSHGDLVIRYRDTKGRECEIDLASMGITCAPDGEWSKSLTVPRED